MNYELAKELKDAGFPQRLGSLEASTHAMFEVERVYRPTLSELIETCEPFGEFALNKISDGPWWASIRDKASTNGLTPDVAVGRLWLALNKK